MSGGTNRTSSTVCPLLLLLATLLLLAPHAGCAAEPPRLAVVISIDQFRYDYLVRFRPHFEAGGFRRLLEGGADFQDCHHRCALTATAPDHASMLSGVHADVHGIVANEWLERDTLRSVGAVEDADAPLVGAAPSLVSSPGGVLASRSGASPRRFLATTVGDQLKLRFAATSRVVSISNKDRAAILMGGKLADAAYWVERGHFVTSRYYRDALPPWAEAFNAEERVEKKFGAEWTRLLDEKIYDAVQGPDSAPGEESRLGLGTTFPRRVDGGGTEISTAFYEAFRITPFSTELLGEFAQRAVRGESLGHHDAPDLFCVSFSQIDYAGHSFGPDSHEVMDGVLRLDRVLADLLAFLDRDVGAGRYTVVLTADHGSAPLPERVQAFGRGVQAGRFDAPGLDRSIESALTAKFGAPPSGELWVARDAYGYHLRSAALEARGIARETAARLVCEVCAAWPQLAAAWTRDGMLALAAQPAGDSLIERVRRSFHPERSQDVVYVYRPFIVDRSPAGTNHGTPYDYDDHVPLVWFGAGITPGVHVERVGMDALAPTLSALLGVPRPPEATGPRLF